MLGSRMESEIREQPELLAKNSGGYYDALYGAFRGRTFEMVVLAARGSSDNAALFGRYLIEVHLGIPVSLAAPSVLTRYGTTLRYPNSLVIGISQSGAAPDVAELLSAQREAGHATLAITNTDRSIVSQAAEHTLLLNTGPETSVAATKTYTSSLLALYELVRALRGNLPSTWDVLPDSRWCDAACAAAEESLGFVIRSSILFSLARGYGFATAQETALKLMECALLPCKSYSVADFQHGPKALAGPGTAAIVYEEEVDDLSKQGCQVISAPRKPKSVPVELRPLWDIFFGQWLSLLAARARAFDPDHPQFIQKVTETR